MCVGWGKVGYRSPVYARGGGRGKLYHQLQGRTLAEAVQGY